MTGLADARRAYLDQPSRFGRDDHATRVAEADAFTAGWEAAQAVLKTAPLIGDRLRPGPPEVLQVDVFTTGNRQNERVGLSEPWGEWL